MSTPNTEEAEMSIESMVKRIIFVLSSALLGIVFGVGLMGFMEPDYQRVQLELPTKEVISPISWGEPCQTSGTINPQHRGSRDEH